MVTLLITSFLLLAGITYVIYLWQRPSSKSGAEFQFQPPPRAVRLFDDHGAGQSPRLELPGAEEELAEQRQSLLTRAAEGDKEALREAWAMRDAALYDEVLNTLVERAASEKQLVALVSFIVRSDEHLRVNRLLAERFIEGWQVSPDRNSTAKMLHVAALADDASLYQRAIETAYQFWRDRQLTGISADELRQLFESEFWLLAPATRNSGAGFLLKRRLAHLRRQLAANDS